MNYDTKKISTALEELHKSKDVSNAAYSTLKFAIEQLTIHSVVLRYSDGNDYSHLKVNSEEHPEHSKCVWCGSTEVTITDESDICHEPDCRYVYT